MTEQEYFDETDYRKYIIQQRALRLKRRIQRMRENDNPYHEMYA